MISIRRQLLLWQIGALAVTGLLISVLTYALAWNGFNQVRDYGLEQIAHSVLRHGVEPDAAGRDEGQFVSQIWHHDGTLAYSSNPAVSLPLQRHGLSVVRRGDDEWHIFTIRRGNLTVQAANTTANRSAMFARITPWLLLPMSLLIALLGGLIWMAVGRALAPLEQIRREIGARDAPTLPPLETRELPAELAPLVGALNDLLLRLNEALSAQRRFIADAAHELRTPLAAVRLQAEVARQARSADEWDAAREQLLGGVERAGRLVEQMLRIARLEHAGSHLASEPVRLDEICKRVVGALSTLAEARHIDLGVARCVPLVVSGDAESLTMMLGNLVDNAIRYTPPGGRVDVGLHVEDDMAVIGVDDSGPGIPPAERQRVFERFYRLAGADVPGSGLGLAIVGDVVRLHHGSVSLGDAPGGGLAAEVRLPLAAPPPAPPTENAGAGVRFSGQ